MNLEETSSYNLAHICDFRLQTKNAPGAAISKTGQFAGLLLLVVSRARRDHPATAPVESGSAQCRVQDDCSHNNAAGGQRRGL